MIYALNYENKRIIASPKMLGICPICKNECVSKCGNIKVWHFAHKNKLQCDSFSEAESYWHLQWKEKFPESMREIVIEHNNYKHIADIEHSGLVLELQHSTISEQEIAQRESFYANMIWLFDLTEKNEEEQFHIRHSKTDWYNKNGFTEVPLDGYITFYMDWGRKIYTKCNKPIFFDIGDGLIEVKKIYPNAKTGGWGYERDYQYLVDLINNERKAETMNEIKIAILNVEKIEGKGSVIGRIDWKLNSTEFYGWKVIKSDTKGVFVAPPSESYETNGEKKYRPLVKFPQELMKTVSEQLLQSWSE